MIYMNLMSVSQLSKVIGTYVLVPFGSLFTFSRFDVKRIGFDVICQIAINETQDACFWPLEENKSLSRRESEYDCEASKRE